MPATTAYHGLMTSTASSCPFCARARLEPDALEQTQDFWVIRDQYGLVPGHLLLIPRNHYGCLGALPEPLLPAFERLKARIGTFLQSEFAAPFFFEHGIAGQTVPHAHLHAVPGRAAILDILSTGRYAIALRDWAEVRRYHQTAGPYLYFEQDGQAWLISGTSVPAGFVRHLAARALGVPERADWRGIEPLDDDDLSRRWREHRERWG